MNPSDTQQGSVSFVQISDTHFGPDILYSRHGSESWPCARDLVEEINHLPTRPDFVIHTGDVADDCPAPLLYATGLVDHLR